jgi:hypothetical protein
MTSQLGLASAAEVAITHLQLFGNTFTVLSGHSGETFALVQGAHLQQGDLAL